MHLQLVYESSMSSVKSFEFMTHLFAKCIKFMKTYILQYEIPHRMNFLDLGHDLLF